MASASIPGNERGEPEKQVDNTVPAGATSLHEYPVSRTKTLERQHGKPGEKMDSGGADKHTLVKPTGAIERGRARSGCRMSLKDLGWQTSHQSVSKTNQIANPRDAMCQRRTSTKTAIGFTDCARVSKKSEARSDLMSLLGVYDHNGN